MGLLRRSCAGNPGPLHPVVRKEKPAATGPEQLAWLLATYHDGPAALQSATTPTGMEYAAKILDYMAKKPWEEK